MEVWHGTCCVSCSAGWNYRPGQADMLLLSQTGQSGTNRLNISVVKWNESSASVMKIECFIFDIKQLMWFQHVCHMKKCCSCAVIGCLWPKPFCNVASGDDLFVGSAADEVARGLRVATNSYWMDTKFPAAGGEQSLECIPALTEEVKNTKLLTQKGNVCHFCCWK